MNKKTLFLFETEKISMISINKNILQFNKANDQRHLISLLTNTLNYMSIFVFAYSGEMKVGNEMKKMKNMKNKNNNKERKQKYQLFNDNNINVSYKILRQCFLTHLM